MEDLISAILNFLQIFLTAINPEPILELEFQSKVTFTRFLLGVVIAGVAYEVLNPLTARHQIFPQTQLRLLRITFSISFGAGVMLWPTYLVLVCSIIFCIITRALDGFSIGFFLGAYYRIPSDSLYSFGIIPTVNIYWINVIYTFFSVIFGIWCIFKLIRNLFLFRDKFVIPLAISLLSIIGLLVIPNTGNVILLFILSMYPLGLILGLVFGYKGLKWVRKRFNSFQMI